MSWVVAGTAAVSLINNASQQAAQKRAQQQQADVAAASQKYAPLTKQTAQQFTPQAQGNMGQTLGAGISGALAGKMQEQQNDRANAQNAAITDYYKSGGSALPQVGGGQAMPGMGTQEQASGPSSFWNMMQPKNKPPTLMGSGQLSEEK